MDNPWATEIWRIIGLLILGLLVGIVLGAVAWSLLLIMGAYFAWHLRNLYRLNQWLQGRRGGFPDAIGGAWADVYYHLYRLQQRNRRRKKRLATMLNRFRESTDAMPDAAVVLDANGVIESWNKAASEMLGLRHPQDLQHPITNLIRHPDFIQYAARGEFDKPVQIPAPHRDDIMLSLRIVPYGNNQRLLLVRDFTRLYRLEQMRRDFIANVSHELRTPLTVVAGYLETLLDGDEDESPAQHSILQSMQQQTLRMQNIVTDLLLLSRLETDTARHTRQLVDVPAMLQMVLEDAQALSGKQHRIRMETDHNLWLHANREELLSAFSNLVYNAVKYTPAGGEITLRWFADAQGAHFAVQDTGVGIAPHHIPRLTERFYRVDVGRSRAAGGTGLGLAIVKHVLNRHGASLHIESRLNQGSQFRCDFPQGLVREREVA